MAGEPEQTPEHDPLVRHAQELDMIRPSTTGQFAPRRRFALASAATILFLGAAAVAPGSESPAPPGQPASPPSAQSDARDNGWPRQFETATHLVRVHQPQVEEWPNFDRIRFRAAIVVTPKDKDEPVYGTIVVSSATKVAFEERLVALTDRKLEQIEFPGAEPAEAERLKAIVMEAAPPEMPQTVALDRIVAELDVGASKVRSVDVNLAPPKILTSDKPAIMITFLGKPRLTPIPNNDLLVAVNTNWDVFFDPAAKRYYLLNEDSWLTTTDLDKGLWAPSPKLPAGLSKLPADDNWSDVRKSLPGVPPAQMPAVFVSHEPAELIVTEGTAQMEPIPGTTLMMIANTENDLFYKADEKQYFLLAAGRWFKAPALAGPWTAASASLPADFRKIPEDSEAGSVLASVPGTPAANEAVILASIPNKATVNKSEVTVNVTYDGKPDFRPVEQTTVKYAYNSPFSVFLVDNKYYCCHNAVWFVAPAASGAWAVCTNVPAAIYTIPPTHPTHNVTYVTVYESTPTTVVTGYTAGYSGATVAATGAVMFGLGVLIGAAIDDDDYWGYHYNSCFFSYGCGAAWSNHGGFVCAGRRYGPYGGCGGFAAYNPSNGFYSRGAYAYGPRGAAGVRTAYNPATGAGGYRAGAVTPHGSWSRGAVTNGDDWVRGGQASGARGTVKGIEGSGGAGAIHAEGRWGNGATVARDKDGDLYAGKDGNVYKKSDEGWTQQRGSSSSRSTQPATPATRNSQPAPRETRPASAQPPRDAGDLQRQASTRERGNKNASRQQQPARGSGGGGRGRGR
jgi:hypothetical protein